MNKNIIVKTITSSFPDSFEEMLTNFYEQYIDYNIECMYYPLIGNPLTYTALLIARRK